MNKIPLEQFHQIVKEWLETKKIAISFEDKLEDGYEAWLEYRDNEMLVNIYYRPKVKGPRFGFALDIERGNEQSETGEYYSDRLTDLLSEFEKSFFTYPKQV